MSEYKTALRWTSTPSQIRLIRQLASLYFASAVATLLRADATPFPGSVAVFNRTVKARTWGTLLLSLGALALLGFAWRDR
jgi:hypothetical protein